MISNALPTIQEIEGEFSKFAEFLFSQETPPEKGTLFIDLDCKNDKDYTDFLYDLFCYGYSKKFGDLHLKDFTETHFNTIRDYIRSIGVDTILLDFTVNNDNNVITDFKIGFKPYININ